MESNILTNAIVLYGEGGTGGIRETLATEMEMRRKKQRFSKGNCEGGDRGLSETQATEMGMRRNK